MSDSSTKQTKALGIWTSSSLVVGTMIGAGIYLIPASLAHYGPISIFGWVVTAIGAISLALLFASLSRAFPKAGGPYAYSRAAFGDLIGFQVAWCYWASVWIGNAAISISMASYLSFFFPELLTNSLYNYLVIVGVIWGLTGINILGVKEAGLFQLISTIIKIVPLLAVAILGIAYIDLNNFTLSGTANVTTFSAITASAALTLWAFIGLEAATIPANHVKNPEKTIPRATILGTGFVAFIYIATTAVVMGMIPSHELAQMHTPFTTVAREIFGSWGAPIIAASAVFSCIGGLNGWILLQAQVPQVAAEDGLFPKFFAKTNKNGVPYIGLLISSVLVSILLAFNYSKGFVEQFTIIVEIGTVAILIPYLYASVSELYLSLIKGVSQIQGKLWKHFLVTIIGFSYALWALLGTGSENIALMFVLLLGSLPMYVLMKWKLTHKK